MLTLLWPRERQDYPDIFTRFGRVVHWTGLVIFLALLAGATLVTVLDRDEAAIFFLVAYFGLPVYFLARGVRYIVGGE